MSWGNVLSSIKNMGLSSLGLLRSGCDFTGNLVGAVGNTGADVIKAFGNAFLPDYSSSTDSSYYGNTFKSRPERPGGENDPSRNGSASRPGRPGGENDPSRNGSVSRPGRPGGENDPSRNGSASRPGRPGGENEPTKRIPQ